MAGWRPSADQRVLSRALHQHRMPRGALFIAVNEKGVQAPYVPRTIRACVDLTLRGMSHVGQNAKFRVDQRTSALAPKPDTPLLMARTDDVMPAASGPPARGDLKRGWGPSERMN